MPTECNERAFEFQPLGSRASDGPIRRRDDHFGCGRPAVAGSGGPDRACWPSLARCFDDHRDPELIEHTVEELLKQRVFALALGYEDLNDHDQLRADPLLAVLVGKRDPTGQERARAARPRQAAGRQEHAQSAGADAGRGRRQAAATRRSWLGMRDIGVVVRRSVSAAAPHSRRQRSFWTWMPPTIRLHGHQVGPLLPRLLRAATATCRCTSSAASTCCCAKLRPADIDAAAGSGASKWPGSCEQIRQRWPQRADHPARRQRLLPREPDAWCEDNRVDYLFGLAKNKRLTRILGQRTARGPAAIRRPRASRPACSKTSPIARARVGAASGAWSARPSIWPRAPIRGSWSRRCRPSDCAARALYEELYCARGDMENRIKEQQLCLFADRTSCQTMRANQLRLWLSSAAYVLLQALRQYGSEGHAAGAGPLRHDPPEAAEDRGGGAGDRAPGVVLAVRELSVSGVVPPGVRPICGSGTSTASGPCVNRRRPVHVPKFEWPFRLSDALAAARTTRNRLSHEPLQALYATHSVPFSPLAAQPRSNDGSYTRTTRPNHRPTRQSFRVVRNAG